MAEFIPVEFPPYAQESIERFAQTFNLQPSHLYETLIREKMISGIIGMTWWVIPIILLFFILRYIVKNIDDVDHDWAMPVGSLSGIAFIIIIVIGIMTTTSSVSKVFNPEYHVTQDMIAFIHELKEGPKEEEKIELTE